MMCFGLTPRTRASCVMNSFGFLFRVAVIESLHSRATSHRRARSAGRPCANNKPSAQRGKRFARIPFALAVMQQTARRKFVF